PAVDNLRRGVAGLVGRVDRQGVGTVGQPTVRTTVGEGDRSGQGADERTRVGLGLTNAGCIARRGNNATRQTGDVEHWAGGVHRPAVDDLRGLVAGQVS